jgi:C1A family cysteine protease
MAYEGIEVGDIRAAIQREGAQWEAGETSLTQLPLVDRRLRLGYTPGPDEAPLVAREDAARANLRAPTAWASAVGAPVAFDLRNVNGSNFITPIRDQGGCGSCVAFGTVATIEGTLRFNRGDPNLAADFSEAQLFYCYGQAAGRNCGNGWWVPPALDATKNGLAVEAAYPYVAGDQNCTNLAADWKQRSCTVTGWHEVTVASDMKAWLSTRGPLAACFTVYDDFFSYRSGIYRHVTGGVAGGHCISIVGYSDTDQCWIAKNSWNTTWGDQGFFRIAYGQCGIDASMWAVEGVTLSTWQRGKTIRGLWTIDQDRNAWAYVDTVGWKRVSPDNDPIFVDMLGQLIAAKAAARPVDIYEEQDVIKQLYVW